MAGALPFGAAASLPVSSENLGSGGIGVVSCDPDGVDVSYLLKDTEPHEDESEDERPPELPAEA